MIFPPNHRQPLSGNNLSESLEVTLKTRDFFTGFPFLAVPKEIDYAYEVLSFVVDMRIGGFGVRIMYGHGFG